MRIKVTKSNGQIEDLSPEKLRISLKRSGASDEEAESVIKKILQEVGPLTSTKKIYRLANKYLRQFNRASGLRYSLKQALFRLGPSGYPFEKYYSQILRNYGFETETGIILQGKCVKHEVDVVAVSNKEVYLVECKYHNRPGISVDVKVAMYVYSRFKDLAPVISLRYPGRRVKGWLVTNTRLTSDALQFAGCYKFNVKAWRYPDKISLEKMIEDKRLYPVTIISGIKSGLINSLIQKNVILLKDLVAMDISDLKQMLSLPEKKARALKKQADDLCGC